MVESLRKSINELLCRERQELQSVVGREERIVKYPHAKESGLIGIEAHQKKSGLICQQHEKYEAILNRLTDATIGKIQEGN